MAADEDETILNPRTILSPRTDGYTYIDTEDLFKYSEVLNSFFLKAIEAGVTLQRLRIVQVLRNIKPEVLLHLDRYGAYTYGELERTLGMAKNSVHYITNRLLYLHLVTCIKIDKPRYIKHPGPAPYVWLLVGEKPEKAAECMTRHYKTMRIETFTSSVIEDLREPIDRLKALFISKDEYGKQAPRPDRIREYFTHRYPGNQPEDTAAAVKQIHHELCEYKGGG